jgi:hypothetical protein
MHKPPPGGIYKHFLTFVAKNHILLT